MNFFELRRGIGCVSKSASQFPRKNGSRVLAMGNGIMDYALGSRGCIRRRGKVGN